MVGNVAVLNETQPHECRVTLTPTQVIDSKKGQNHDQP
jgi:alanine dehydrogenase